MKTIAEMPLVCSFEQLGEGVAGDAALSWVGGKGANLGELSREGFPVPPGYCVTTRGYQLFLEGGGARLEALFGELEALDVSDLGAVRRCGEAMRSHLHGLALPEAVEAAVVEAWQELGVEGAYAVRSSATAEDLPDASFAGQQDTYLNVRGREALLEKVRACWASLFTDRAIVYRVQHGFDHREVALSVVVQRMVLPEISGILFSADPLSQNRQVLSIDAGFGLGEALVSGKVSADLYRVRKDSMEILSREIADKHMQIRPLVGGGVVEEELPPERRQAPVMNDAQILELAAMGARIEAYYGAPQDVEWCFEGDRLYIVQSRPITSLYPQLEPLPRDGSLHVYICFNHLQVMLDPIKPLGLSLLKLIVPFGKDGQVTTYTRFAAVAGGRLFIDPTELLRHPKPHRLVPQFLTVADELTAASLAEVVNRPRFLREMKKAFRFSWLHPLRRILLPLARRLAANLWLRAPEGRLEQLHAHVDQMLADAREEIFGTEPGIGRLQKLYQFLGTLFVEQALRHFLPVIASGVLSAKILGKLTGRSLNDPVIGALMGGLEGNVTTEMDLQVADLADLARPHPELVERLRSDPTAGVLGRLDDVEGGPAFAEAFQGFLDQYGSRGASEIDVTRVRWSEDPTPLLQTIAGNLTSPEMGTHRQNHKRAQEAAARAAEQLIAEASSQALGGIKGRIARRMVRVNRNLMGGRESPKFMLIRALGLAKEAILEEARSLAQRGQLDDPYDAYYLEIDELMSMVEGGQKALDGSPWKLLIERRKEAHERHLKLKPPRVLTSEGESIVAHHSRDDLPPGALAGTAASPGVVEGVARVIFDPMDAVLHDGEILVAPFTDPGWTPLFIHASGLVMEVGGLMTHGSVVAREYGIPAVVCVPDATARIETGQRLRVHGDAGYVELLPDAPEDAGEAQGDALAEGAGNVEAQDSPGPAGEPGVTAGSLEATAKAEASTPPEQASDASSQDVSFQDVSSQGSGSQGSSSDKEPEPPEAAPEATSAASSDASPQAASSDKEPEASGPQEREVAS